MLGKLRHKALAETHDLCVGSAFRVKIAAALAAAHGQARKAVFEHLLKAQELNDGRRDGRMQAQAALVRADGGVELHAVAAVHMHLARVVHPGNTELNEAFRLHHTLQNALLFQFGMLFHISLQALQHLAHSLQKFGFARAAPAYFVIHARQIIVFKHNLSPFPVARAQGADIYKFPYIKLYPLNGIFSRENCSLCAGVANAAKCVLY